MPETDKARMIRDHIRSSATAAAVGAAGVMATLNSIRWGPKLSETDSLLAVTVLFISASLCFVGLSALLVVVLSNTTHKKLENIRRRKPTEAKADA